MNCLLRPRIWPSSSASSGVGSCDVPFRYASGPIPRYRGTVARWHVHLRGLVTAIHETSGIAISQRVIIENTCQVERKRVIMKILGKSVGSALIVLFLSIGLCLAQDSVNESTTKGVYYGGQGKFKEAATEFEKALKVDPSFGPAQRALKIIEDATNHKIESQTAINYFKGIAHSIKGQHEQAIPYYNKAIEINPRFANAYFSRGVAFAEGKGQYDEAISDYNKAIEINPKFAKAILLRGFAHYLKAEYDKAWVDVHEVQSLGAQVPPGFLKALKEVSARQK
jgi:tetratricopeptide (TPR) repeat protein